MKAKAMHGSESMETGPTDQAMAGKTRPRGWWRLALLIGLFLAALILIRFFDLSSQLVAWRNWLKELGPLAPLAFFVIYIIVVLATVPNGALGIAGGVLFGSVAGVVLVSTAATAGKPPCVRSPGISSWRLRSTGWAKTSTISAQTASWKSMGRLSVALTRLIPIFPLNFLELRLRAYQRLLRDLWFGMALPPPRSLLSTWWGPTPSPGHWPEGTSPGFCWSLS